MDSNDIDIDNFAFNESEGMEEEYDGDGDTQVENTSAAAGKEKTAVQSKPTRKRKETSKVWKVRSFHGWHPWTIHCHYN